MATRAHPDNEPVARILTKRPSKPTRVSVLGLQCSIGNRAVGRLLAQPVFGGPRTIIQAKLTVNAPGDEYEREADRVADAVMRIPAVQRKDLDESEKPQIMTKGAPAQTAGGAFEAGEAFEQQLRATRGQGQPLPASLREEFETKLGVDFSGVRIHTDALADQLNQSIQAKAFTTGQHVFFRQGAYDPISRSGQAVLAHELTHVVQQGSASMKTNAGGVVQRDGEDDESRKAIAKQRRRAMGMSAEDVEAEDATEKFVGSAGQRPPGSAVVQRLISANKFEADTSFSWFLGKSDETFRDIVAGLRAYEAPGGGARELRNIYDTATGWLYSVGSRGSSRAGHVERLVEELGRTPELQRMPDVANVRVTTSALPKEYKDRACRLIAAPDEINQTAFGVCGLVSILRPVLTYSPVRFADLAIKALTDPSLDQKKWKQVFASKANDDQKKLGVEFEYLVAQWLVRHAAKGDVSQTVLERQDNKSVGEVTKTKRYSEVFAAQKAFSETFKKPGWEDVSDHFATTTGGLNYLLTSVVGASGSYKIKVKDFGADYHLAKTKAGQKGQVIASVTDTDFYQQAGAAIRSAPAKPGPGEASPKYRHWVIIDNVQLAGDYFDITIWTWAKLFTAKVHKDVVGAYFYSFVAASLD